MFINNNSFLLNLVNFFKRNSEDFDDKTITYYSNAYSDINRDVFELLNYNDLFVDILKDDYKELILTLKVLKNNSFVELSEVQKNRIKESSIYIKCIQFIKDKIDYYIDVRRKKTNDIIFELEKIGNKLIDEKIINEIFDYLKEYDFSYSDIKIVSEYILKHNSNVYEMGKNSFKLLNNDELSIVFDKYGYDYNSVPDNFKQILLTKGNVVNIEQIFEKFKEYNIIFKEDDRVFLYILVKSDKYIIDEICNLGKIYNFDFYKVLRKIPGIFMHKNYEKLRSNISNIGNSDSFIGAYEDFTKNLNLIKEIGYDIEDVFKKSSSIFIVPFSKLKKNVLCLYEYGFPKNLYSAGLKLSALKSSDILSTIDMFIELDELRYAEENTSRLSFGHDSYIFYRLYFAKKYNLNSTQKLRIKRIKDGKEILTGIISNKFDRTLDSLMNYDSLKNHVFDEATSNELREYIECDGSPFDNVFDEFIRNIEEFRVNNTQYVFDGVIISRLKTIRVYSKLVHKYGNYDRRLLLLFSLTYNSILDYKDFERVKRSIENKVIKK